MPPAPTGTAKTLPNLHRSPDLIEQPLRDKLNGLIRGEAPWPLFMYGRAGTGKTMAALCLLDYGGGRYYTLTQLLEDLIESQQGRLTNALGDRIWPPAFWHRIEAAPLFVLDELGCREKITDQHYEAVKRCLDLREGKTLVGISNLDPEHMERLYDARIFSRLASGTVYHAAGEDRRFS